MVNNNQWPHLDRGHSVVRRPGEGGRGELRRRSANVDGANSALALFPWRGDKRDGVVSVLLSLPCSIGTAARGTARTRARRRPAANNGAADEDGAATEAAGMESRDDDGGIPNAERRPRFLRRLRGRGRAAGQIPSGRRLVPATAVERGAGALLSPPAERRGPRHKWMICTMAQTTRADEDGAATEVGTTVILEGLEGSDEDSRDGSVHSADYGSFFWANTYM